MTRQERAKLTRTERRMNELFIALCIIKTWIGVVRENETADDLLFRISRFCEEKIQADRREQVKEEKRSE